MDLAKKRQPFQQTLIRNSFNQPILLFDSPVKHLLIKSKLFSIGISILGLGGAVYTTLTSGCSYPVIMTGCFLSTSPFVYNQIYSRNYITGIKVVDQESYLKLMEPKKSSSNTDIKLELELLGILGKPKYYRTNLNQILLEPSKETKVFTHKNFIITNNKNSKILKKCHLAVENLKSKAETMLVKKLSAKDVL